MRRGVAEWARRLAGFVAAVTALVATAPATAHPPRLLPGADMPPAELEAYVDGVVGESLARDHVAGALVSVVQDGKVVLSKGYGLADVARHTPADPARSLFRIGSISKTFTWIMALRAVEERRMTLDAPLNTYLSPALRIPDQGFAGQPVRLRDVMTHTPGFEDRVFGVLFVRDQAALGPPQAFLAAHRPARVRPPGQISAYSNYGAALAGMALQQVEGRAWQDLLEAQILVPAGMTSTTGREPYRPRAGLPAPMPPTLAARLSKPYRWTGAGFAEQPFEYVGAFAPAGAISGTADDMGRYMRALLDDGRIDGRTLYGPGVARAIRAPMLAQPGGAGVDGGFFQVPLEGGFLSYGHAGGTLAFHSNMLLVPQLRLGVFVATNTETEHLTDALAERIVGRFYGAEAPPLPPMPTLGARQGAYAGGFIDSRRPFHGLEAFARRFLPTPVRIGGPGYLLVGGQRYVPAGALDGDVVPFRSAEHPALVLLAHKQGGRMVWLESPTLELERQPWWRTTATIERAALVTMLVALAVLAGPLSAARRRAPQTGLQRKAGWLRAAVAGLWLLSIGAFAAQLAQALADRSSVVYQWPTPLVLTASTAGLVAALLSVILVAFAGMAWPQPGGWTRARKLRFSATVAVFVAFGGLTAALGALQPWNP